MKQKLKPLKVIMIVLFLSAFLSCDSDKKKESTTEATETTATPTNTSTTENNATTDRMNLAGNPAPFYTLKLDSASLYALVNSSQVKKLIIQIVDSSADAYLAIAYGCKSNNETVTGPVALTALPNPITSIPAPVVMGDQELSLKNLKDVFFLTGSGKMNPDQCHDLKFVPSKQGTNHIFYTVTQLIATGGSGSANTNPSPPAAPCSTNCD